MYGEGISREGDLLDLAAERGLITKSGAWYSHQEERIGQGRENAKKYLRDNPALAADLDGRLRRELGLVRATTGAEEPGK
jgi:recombination protein RecA